MMISEESLAHVIIKFVKAWPVQPSTAGLFFDGMETKNESFHYIENGDSTDAESGSLVTNLYFIRSYLDMPRQRQ